MKTYIQVYFPMLRCSHLLVSSRKFCYSKLTETRGAVRCFIAFWWEYIFSNWIPGIFEEENVQIFFIISTQEKFPYIRWIGEATLFFYITRLLTMEIFKREPAVVLLDQTAEVKNLIIAVYMVRIKECRLSFFGKNLSRRLQSLLVFVWFFFEEIVTILTTIVALLSNFEQRRVWLW